MMPTNFANLSNAYVHKEIAVIMINVSLVILVNLDKFSLHSFKEYITDLKITVLTPLIQT